MDGVRNDNEVKKEYLRSYQNHVRRIRRIEEEVAELREMMQSCRAIGYDDMPHGSGGQSDLSNSVAEMQSMIDELRKESEQRYRLYKEVVRRINKLKSARENDVLFYRYIKGFGFWEIAEKLNYSERQIRRFHGLALAHFELPSEKDVR